MKVMKFGGTSIAAAERIEHALDLVETALATDRVTVVASAFGGVTDQLIELMELALAGNDYATGLAELQRRHRKMVYRLVNRADEAAVFGQIQIAITDFRDLLEKIRQNSELSDQDRDRGMSCGEYLSTLIVAAALRSRGLEAEQLDARQVVLTDDHFGQAFVHYQKSYDRIRTYLRGRTWLQVVTGFIGATEDGRTTTLGRSGSDYTAAIFGAALNAGVIEIWTDVDGIMSADPRVIKGAGTIPHLTYEEAMELAHAGARVIFPPTTIPALYKGIPIHIRNTLNSGHPGTLITRSRKLNGEVAVGISSLSDITLIRLQGAGMVGRYGVIGRTFAALAQEKINIILVSQVFSEHSICFAIDPCETPQAVAALEQEFSFEMENRYIDEIKVEEHLSLMALVGEGMRQCPGIAGRVFNTLGRKNINVIAIAQGSSERNISFIINDFNQKKALLALHAEFFVYADQQAGTVLNLPQNAGGIS
ncbi:MAG: aspartate kinase [Candidatus Neomarinimicrobiota bacterium]